MNKVIKKIVLFLFIVSLNSFMGFGQMDHKADSLLTRLSFEKNDTNKVALLLSLCKEKWKYAHYSEAKKYADEALALSQKINHKNGVADAYCQIGIVYWYVLDNRSALTYHIKALGIYNETGNKTGISDALNRIGHDYADLPNYLKAIYYFQQALDLDEQLQNKDGITKNLNLIGYIYMCLKDYPMALNYYSKALQLAEPTGNKRAIAAVNHDIGVVYEKQNKPELALKHATKGLEYALQVGEMHLLEEAYMGLEIIYLRLNNFKEAYNTRLKYDEIGNTLRTADQAGKIKQMEMQYAFNSKQLGDSLKIVQEQEIGNIKLQKQKILNYFFFAGIAIAVVLLFFAYRNYDKQRIANKKLKEAQQRLLESEKMAAFGAVADRMSHEILNPLNFVNNFSMISLELADDIINATDENERREQGEVLKESLKKIERHGKRAASIVNQIQQHVKDGTTHTFFEDDKGK